MTLISSPADAWVALRGSSELMGNSPLDLGPGWSGRYIVTITAPGCATARGALFFPPRGSRPYSLSDPPGVSGGLLLRSLNVPGVPELMSGSQRRGLALLTAGAGGVLAMTRDHIKYRDNLANPDEESQDRARNFRYARARWALYTGAVWGLSALDYIVRPRMSLLESIPTRVTVGTPRLKRADVVWRSILIPGAGQDYANRRVRGLFWLGASLSSGAAFIIADESHYRIRTKLGRARALLAAASPGEVPDRQADVDHFTSLEETSRRLVHELTIGTAGIYLANIIDAGIVPLNGGSTAVKKASIEAPLGARRAAIALRYRF